jgi:hypothetical protein
MNETERKPLTCNDAVLSVGRWGFKSPSGHFLDVKINL